MAVAALKAAATARVGRPVIAPSRIAGKAKAIPFAPFKTSRRESGGCGPSCCCIVIFIFSSSSMRGDSGAHNCGVVIIVDVVVNGHADTGGTKAEACSIPGAMMTSSSRTAKYTARKNGQGRTAPFLSRILVAIVPSTATARLKDIDQ